MGDCKHGCAAKKSSQSSIIAAVLRDRFCIEFPEQPNDYETLGSKASKHQHNVQQKELLYDNLSLGGDSVLGSFYDKRLDPLPYDDSAHSDDSRSTQPTSDDDMGSFHRPRTTTLTLTERTMSPKRRRSSATSFTPIQNYQSGFMKCYTPGALVSRTYWFVLQQSVLSYYTDTFGPMKGTFIVAHVSKNATPRPSLLVCGLNSTALVLEPESEAVMESWFAALAEAASSRMVNLVTELEATSNDWVSKSLSIKGWLVKEGRLFKTWRRRFAVLLENGLFAYYPDDKPWSVPKYKAYLHSISFWEGKQNGLVMALTDGRVLKASAPTVEEQLRWIAVGGKIAEKRRELDYTQPSYEVDSDEDRASDIALL